MTPIVTTVVSKLTGLEPAFAGLVASTVAYCLTVPLAFATYRSLLGDERAGYLVAFMLATPISLYSTSLYSEPVFGFFLILGFWAGLQKKWLLAGLAFACLSASRSVGAFAVFPLLIMIIQGLGFSTIQKNAMGILRGQLPNENVCRAGLAIMLAPLGVFLYILYLRNHVGDGFAFKHVTEVGWNWVWRSPWETINFGFRNYEDPKSLYLTLTGLLGMGLCGVLFWKGRLAEATYFAIILFIALTGLLNSTHRYAFGHFLPYLGLALLLPRSKLVAASVASLMIATWGIYISAWLLKMNWVT